MKLVALSLSLLFVTAFGCASSQKVAETAVDYTKCRAMQVEATTALKTVHAAQKDKKDARDTYSKTIGELGVDVEEAMLNYNIKLVEVKSDKFRAQAIGRQDTASYGDTWEINEAGELTHPKDGCAPK